MPPRNNAVMPPRNNAVMPLPGTKRKEWRVCYNIMKKVIIMGATSGLGLGVAEALASRGLRIGVAGRNESALKKLHDKYPECIVSERIDINRPGAPESLQRLIEKLGGMDIYLHASGIGYENPDLNPEKEAEIVQTDTVGFARMVMAAFRYFAENRRKGTIAAITSVAGTKGIGLMAAYSASKRFDTAYLSALRQLVALKRLDIHITDIRPGWTRTPLLKEGDHYPLEMEQDTVVAQIIKAMVRHPRTAVIDWRWNLLVRAWQLLPDTLWERIPYRP